MLSDETKRAADGALAHAGDLLDAAEQLLSHHPHLAYHLAVLSLEETGRSHLIVLEKVAEARTGQAGARRRERDDHVRKLFWALWGPSFGREQINGEQIERFRGLADLPTDLVNV